MRPKPSNDKNCQSVQFMWPRKPNSVVQLTEPAVYLNTRKMQSERPHMQSTQVNDSSVEKVQSQSRSMKPKKMHPVMWPVEN